MCPGPKNMKPNQHQRLSGGSKTLTTASRPFVLAAISLLGLATTEVQATNLLQNGSFEDPDVNSSPYFTSFFTGQTVGSGWVVDFTNSGSLVIDNDINTCCGVTWHDTSDGHQYSYLASGVGNTTLRQDFPATASVPYTLSLTLADFATQFVLPGGRVLVDVIDLSNLSSVLGGAQLLQTPDFSGFIPFTIPFVAASSGQHRLLLTSVSGYAGNVDAVVIEPTVNPVPDATSSLGLMTLGLAALGMVGRAGRK